MKFTIRNHAEIPNKYIRYAKWKMRNILKFYDTVEYVEMYVAAEGSSRSVYEATIVLGVPGNDIILKEKSPQLTVLWPKLMQKSKRQLRKHKEKMSRL